MVPDPDKPKETVSVALTQGEIVVQSSNLAGYNNLLDPDGLGTSEVYRLVPHEDTLLRVLTVPVSTRTRSLSATSRSPACWTISRYSTGC